MNEKEKSNKRKKAYIYIYICICYSLMSIRIIRFFCYCWLNREINQRKEKKKKKILNYMCTAERYVWWKGTWNTFERQDGKAIFSSKNKSSGFQKPKSSTLGTQMISQFQHKITICFLSLPISWPFNAFNQYMHDNCSISSTWSCNHFVLQFL